MTVNGPGRVLLIDDNDLVRGLIYDIVTSLGYSADMAASGAEGLAFLDRNRYDVVLTDLVMPGMTGWEVLAAVRERDPKIPVILFTGSAVHAGDARFAQPGVALVQKPVDVQVLENALSRVLANGR
jgi:CheY-like chemotaxis protein